MFNHPPEGLKSKHNHAGEFKNNEQAAYDHMLCGRQKKKKENSKCINTLLLVFFPPSFKKRFRELDTLNGLIQKINSKKPRGTLKPNYSIPKIAAKRVISAGLIGINYSFIIPADHSNYTVLLIYFSPFEDYIQKLNPVNMDLM